MSPDNNPTRRSENLETDTPRGRCGSGDTARDARFVEQVKGWSADRLARDWPGQLAAIYPDGF